MGVGVGWLQECGDPEGQGGSKSAAAADGSVRSHQTPCGVRASVVDALWVTGTTWVGACVQGGAGMREVVVKRVVAA